MDTNFTQQLTEHLPKIKNFIKSRFRSSTPQWREDLLQDVCLKAWQNYHTLESPQYFSTWVIRIASNTGINSTRGLDRLVSVDLHSFVDPAPSADTILFSKEINAAVERAITGLPKSQRESFQLFYLEDMAFKDVAEIVGGNYNTAKANCRHAVIKVRKHLAYLVNELDGQKSRIPN